jgi:hypothetical protein
MNEKLKKKTISVFLPDSWQSLVQKGRMKNSSNTLKMETADFKDFDTLSSSQNPSSSSIRRK